jgi:hypothetical protein
MLKFFKIVKDKIVPRPEISIKHPHDSFFKKLFDNEENIRDFLRVYLRASLLLMKNIFKNVAELKPVLKEIVMLDDDRVIRL